MTFDRSHSAILRLPFVEDGVADPVLAAELLGSKTGFLFDQDRDNLLISKSAPSHCPSPTDGPNLSVSVIQGSRSDCSNN
jgi:hypothetical protein